MQNFTSDDLLLYIFSETDELSSSQIKSAISSDFKLRNQYLQLKQSIGEVSGLVSEPSELLMQHIMRDLQTGQTLELV